MKNRLFILSVILIMSIFVVATSSQAITLGFNPNSQVVLVGDYAYIDLVISGLGAGASPSLSTFDLDISFDPGILDFNNAAFGDPILGDQLDLFGFGSITDVIPGVGTVNLFELSFDLPFDLIDLQADSFILASLTFDTLAIGTSPLNIFVNALGDESGDPLDPITESASISAAVPEPATLFLLVIGLMGLGYLKKRRF